MKKRKNEIQELQAEIYRRKNYDYRGWCKGFIVQSPSPNWSYLLIAGGDKRAEVDAAFLSANSRRLKVVEVDGVPTTVVQIKNGLVEALKRSASLRTFYRCLTHIVAESDIKRWHYDLWLNAHNLEARIKRLQELQRPSAQKDGIGREIEGMFSNNNIREAAKHYGSI